MFVVELVRKLMSKGVALKDIGGNEDIIAIRGSSDDAMCINDIKI